MSENLIEFYQGFSGPSYGLDDALLEHTVISHASASLQAFMSQHGDTVSSFSPSLKQFLNQACHSELAFSSVWCPPFGALSRCLALPNPDASAVINVAVTVAWQLSLAGMSGQWSGECNNVDRLMIGDWVLPAFDAINVEGKSGALSVKAVESDGSKKSFNFSYCKDKGWVAEQSMSSCLKNHSSDGVKMLTEGLKDNQNFSYLKDQVLPTSRVSEAIEKHQAAMRLLTTKAPEYAAWVNRVIRAIIPLETKTGSINSGSSKAELGVIHASVDCPVEGYAEMLVHEASHQYFYILRRLGGVDDGSDPNLYFSPVKQTGRPIGMILLAYHAFANVVLLGRSCIEKNNNNESDYFLKNEAFLQPQLDLLEQGLKKTEALTPLGIALWHPLQAQLCQTA